jgi:ribose transport system permease protein
VRRGGPTQRIALGETDARAGAAAGTEREPPPPGEGIAPGARGRFDARGFAGRYAVVFALIAMIAVFSVLRPDTFFTRENFESILVTESVLVIIALGVTIALAAGEFDLSVAAVVGFSAGLFVHMDASVGWSLGPALLLTFLAALAVGVANAIFVVGFGVNSFIATLGMGSIVGGLALAIFGAETIGGLSTDFTDVVRSEVFGIGVSALFAIALGAILWYCLEHTPTGRHLFFTGEGREAARLAGVRVNRIRFGALIASALFAWLAGVVLAGQTGAAQASFGNPFLLPAFAAGFLGATTIKPGRYNAWGTVVAVYLIAVGTTGLQLLGAADWVDDVFNGGALVLAVTLSRLISRQE